MKKPPCGTSFDDWLEAEGLKDWVESPEAMNKIMLKIEKARSHLVQIPPLGLLLGLADMKAGRVSEYDWKVGLTGEEE